MASNAKPRTLAVDIGGSGVKCLVLDADGEMLTERLRRETPDKPTPEPVLDQILEMAEQHGDYERISVGFPGVIVDGEVRTAVNLHDDWVGFQLAGDQISRDNAARLARAQEATWRAHRTEVRRTLGAVGELDPDLFDHSRESLGAPQV